MTRQKVRGVEKGKRSGKKNMGLKIKLDKQTGR